MSDSCAFYLVVLVDVILFLAQDSTLILQSQSYMNNRVVIFSFAR